MTAPGREGAAPGEAGPARGASFGATLRGDGTTRFRLWAPSVAAVDLMLDAGAPGARAEPMEREPGGWWTRTAPAPAGTRYRFRLPGGLEVPDPASRSNPDGVHGPSVVVDPTAYRWCDGAWRGRPWREAVVYELHVGTFSPAGTFAGVIERLDHLVGLGVTAIELMPVASFGGHRGWGYDGVLPYAPHAAYGTPDDLRRLVDAAHGRGLMVLLDVVYNHLGPDGNYLHAYAEPFFDPSVPTPWGPAIRYAGDGSEPVRAFFVENALYWLEEHHLDGLRLDAVHAIFDRSPRHVLAELAERVRSGPGRERHVHLILENDDNATGWLAPAGPYDAQWNDDLHHAFHVLLTGERDGYYEDYAEAPSAAARALAEGFVYQGEPSAHRGGRPRGEPSAGHPPTAFVSFLQDHDQVGNRALGERLETLVDERRLEAAITAWLLAPQVPMLFMGEELAEARPFLYFCDFHDELADAVREGRRREFARFARFGDPAARAAIPDPNALATFEASRLDWAAAEAPRGRRRLELYRRLLAVRAREVLPHLGDPVTAERRVLGPAALMVRFRFASGAVWTLLLNLGQAEVALAEPTAGVVVVATPQDAGAGVAAGRLPAAAAIWLREPTHA